MTLKQFLKPDWKKIVIFTIILFIYVLSYVSSTLFYDNPVEYKLIFFPSFHFIEGYGFCKTLNPFGFSITSIITGFTIMYEYSCPIQYYIIDSLFYVIIFYLLSCLIVWVYDKTRKRK